MYPTPPVFTPSRQDEDEDVGWRGANQIRIPSRQEEEFLASLRQESEEVGWGGEEDEEEGKKLMLQAMVRPLLSPPSHGHPDEEGLPRPGFILIDPKAYFIDRDNATTAVCQAKGPDLTGTIKVTFCTATPPLVSYFCVHATAYTHTDFVTDPLILASETDGGLVLLCLIIGKAKSDFFRPACLHFFVYDSGIRGSPPSLKHIQHPGVNLGGNYHFNGPSLAILRHCNRKKKGGRGNPACSQADDSEGDNYHSPTLRPRLPRSSNSADHRSSGFALRPHNASSGGFALQPHSTFALHRHNPSSYALALHPHTASQKKHHCKDCGYTIVARDCRFGYHSPSLLCLYNSVTDCWRFKQVHVSEEEYRGHVTSKTLTIGDDVAWVDLSQNVIFCDVLAENPKVRVLSLPSSPMKERTDPRPTRDIAIIDGCINYIELQHQFDDHGNIAGWITAAKWSMNITGHSQDWHMDYKVSSSDISARSSQFEGNTAEPNFQRLHLGLPNISLDDENIVYFLAKTNFWDSEQTAWVLAIDLKNNAVHEVVEYNAIKTVGLSIGYSASRISKYLRAAPGTKRKQKRQGPPLLRCPSKK